MKWGGVHLIDLHSHILPGLDDGAADLETSLALARIYAAAGFTYVVATPHAVAGETAAGYAGTVRAAVARLNGALQAAGVALRVLPGMEVTLDPRLPHLVADETLLTLGGKNHLLVETPFGRLPLGWRNLVFELGRRGVTVLFAHPERCEHIMKDPTLLDAMVAAGARLQVNWGSFAGLHGHAAQYLARRMAAKGLLHCLATDAHDPHARHAGNVRELSAELIERVGTANVRRLSRENPVRALRGLPMLDLDKDAIPVHTQRRSKWWRWFSG